MNIDRAVEYNKARGYPRKDWQRVQMVLGARPDGLPGKETATEVGYYQAANCLAVDGMVGPNTFAAFMADPAPWSSITEVCQYWDCPAKWTVANSTSLAQELSDHGITHVKTMLTSSDAKTWNPKWTIAQLDAWTNSLAAFGICHITTAWVLPYRDYLQGMARDICDYLEGSIRFEGDAEEHLLEKRINASEYPKDRAELMSDILAVLDAARTMPVAAGISTYADLFGKSDKFHNTLASADVSDVFSLQAYQVAGSTGNQYDSNSPAIKQFDGVKKYHERVSPLATGPMSLAVAQWNQSWVIGDDDAILLAIEQTIRLGIFRVDLWSALHWIAPATVTKKYDQKKAAYNRRALMRLKTLRLGGCS